jgi:biopolymer transport protein ExbD/biopolymer transport protein TolR
MAMDLSTGGGKKGRNRPEMNVTPLVDVVLVLLIIFMVLTPALFKSFWVTIPEKVEDAAPAEGEGPIVVSVLSSGRLRINQTEVTDDELPVRLRRALAARGSRTVVFDAHEDVAYGRAVEAMDLAKAGGANRIAVATEAVPGIE